MLKIFFAFVLSISLTAFGSTPEDCAQNLDRLTTLAHNWQRGWGERGFLSHLPEPTTRNRITALGLGLLWWDLPIFFMRDLESARAFNERLEPWARGIYFIGQEVITILDFLGLPLDPVIPRPNFILQDIAASAFRSAARNGAYEFLPDGQARFLSTQTVLAKIPAENLSIAVYSSPFGRRAYLALPGWIAPTTRGVLIYDADFLKRRAVRRAQNLRERLLRSGYKVEFSHEFARSLELLSRYRKGVPHHVALALHAQGRAFILEVVNPSGLRLAGALGFLIGRAASGETVFVNSPEFARDAIGAKVDPIDLYRVLAVTLLEHFAQSGIMQLDVQMLTNFSNSLGGTLIPREEFLRNLSVSPKN